MIGGHDAGRMEHTGHDFRFRGKPRMVRNFLAYEPDREKAIELVRSRAPINGGELAEAVAEVTENEFVGPGMRPGDVRLTRQT